MDANEERRFAQALELWQLGQTEKARAQFESLVIDYPKNAEIKNSWGIFLVQQNQSLEASAQFKEAVKLSPENASFRSNLGSSLQAQKKINEAIEQFTEAARLDPTASDALYNLANAYFECGRHVDALRSYDGALRLRPDWAAAYLNRGNVHDAMGNEAMALADFTAAINLHPQEGGLYLNRAKIHFKLNQLEQSKQDCLLGLQLNPNLYNLKLTLLEVLLRLGASEEGILKLVHNLEASPTRSYLILGAAYSELGKIDKAVDALEKSIAFDSSNEEAMGLIAQCYLSRGQFKLAIHFGEKAINQGSDSIVVRQNLVLAHQFCSEFEEAIKINESIPLAVRALGTSVYLKQSVADWDNVEMDLLELNSRLSQLEDAPAIEDPWSLFSVCDDPRALKAVAQKYVRQKILPTLQGQKWAAPSVAREGKICIGYFSPDFKDHAVSHVARKLFQSHNRQVFKVIAFSYGRAAPGDEMRSQLKSCFDTFLDVQNLTDDEIAQLAKAEGVEIAIDLAGLTGEVRTGLWGRRLAPVQVNYLGFVGTTGTAWHDYIIADTAVIPMKHLGDFSEKVVHLPIYMPYDTDIKRGVTPPTRLECGLPPEGFVFCCFNNNFKITKPVFNSWMRILKATPGSCLWLRDVDVKTKQRLLVFAETSGVKTERLIFAPKLKHNSDHLARYARADLFLDTYPYNAHATAMDALWMGLPLLTRCGSAMHARVASSLLKSIGLDELIFSDAEAYEQAAIQLALEPARYAKIKKKLMDAHATDKVFSIETYTRNLDKAFMIMSERCRQGLAPGHFTIS